MSRSRFALGELCTLVKGDSPISKTVPGPYPLVTTGAIHGTSDRYQFDSEAVCIPLVSSTGHGHASLKRVHYLSGRFALGNLLAAAIVKDREVISAKFLARYLMFMKDRLIVPLMTGAANMTISLERLATVPVHLPPLSEQQRISNQLDSIDELRGMRLETDSRTNALIPAIFAKTFGTNSGKKDFPIEPLGKHIDLQTGFAFRSDGYVPPGESVRLCRGANILPEGIDWSDVRYWPQSDVARYAAFELREGDLVLALDRPWISSGLKIASIDREDLPCLLVQRVARIRPKETLLADFIYHSLRQPEFIAHCSPLSTETTVPHISPNDIRDFPIPIPPRELQVAFAARVHEIRALENDQRISRRAIDALQHAFHARAFGLSSKSQVVN